MVILSTFSFGPGMGAAQICGLLLKIEAYYEALGDTPYSSF